MWLMASELPVRLEELDQRGECAFHVEARLVHLDEDYALLSLDELASSRRLHWGAAVRFELEDGMRRYEVTGSIVARNEDPSHDLQPGHVASVALAPVCELRVRIWDCSLNVQRRAKPRRRLGFHVRLSGLGDSDASVAASAAVPDEAIAAWCVDVGAGGIRVRTGKLDNIPQRMRLEFCLPTSDGEHGVEQTHRFSLAGRVIRALPQGRNGDSLDIALCFEGLTVRDGMALHNLLA